MANTSMCGDDMTTPQWEALSSEIEKVTATVLSIFRDADPVETKRKIQAAVLSSGILHTEGDGCFDALMAGIVDDFCEHGYPRGAGPSAGSHPATDGGDARGVSRSSKGRKRKAGNDAVDQNYASLAAQLLFNEFRRVPVVQLRRALAAHGGRYSDAYIAVACEARRVAALKERVAGQAGAQGAGTEAAVSLAGDRFSGAGNRIVAGDSRNVTSAGVKTEQVRPCSQDAAKGGNSRDHHGTVVSDGGSSLHDGVADGGIDEVPGWAAPRGLQEIAHGRAWRSIDVSSCPALQFDLCCVRQWREAQDVRMLAQSLEEEEQERQGHVDCGCCYSDHPIEVMAQCQDGHLFCRDCVKKYVEDVLFGTTRADSGLPCMFTDGVCEAHITDSQLRVALPSELLDKFEKKQVADSVQQAQLPGLTRCHACEFAAELLDDAFVLDCPNCEKRTCRSCGDEAHIPLRCEEVEKKDQASVRHSIEELMTRKMVRECSACKTKIMKEEGCNKITCRCGAWTCYVCREGIPKHVGYKHFCQHVLDPGQSCRECQRCLLWQDNKRVEEAELKELQKESVREAAAKDPGLAQRLIGPDLAR